MKKIISFLCCAFFFISGHAENASSKNIASIQLGPSNVILFWRANRLIVANAKEKTIRLYDVLGEKTIQECKLDISGESLRLSSDGNFLLSDAFYAKTSEVESCAGTIRFNSIDGTRRKIGDVVNSYPFNYVVDANLKSNLFFFLNMAAAQPTKSYSGYVGILNTKKKILEVGKDIHPGRQAEMAFSLYSKGLPKFSRDGTYIKISSIIDYPGTYEIRSRKKVDADDPEVVAQFKTAEKWNLSQDPDVSKELYASSENQRYLVTNATGATAKSISKDGNLVAVVYPDYDAWKTRIEIFCRDCQ
jgi:hypothetical protein